MSYLDKYPNCIDCPVTKYCGTMVSSIKLCHSCDESSVEKTDAYAVEHVAMSL